MAPPVPCGRTVATVARAIEEETKDDTMTIVMIEGRELRAFQGSMSEPSISRLRVEVRGDGLAVQVNDDGEWSPSIGSIEKLRTTTPDVSPIECAPCGREVHWTGKTWQLVYAAVDEPTHCLNGQPHLPNTRTDETGFLLALPPVIEGFRLLEVHSWRAGDYSHYAGAYVIGYSQERAAGTLPPYVVALLFRADQETTPNGSPLWIWGDSHYGIPTLEQARQIVKES